MGKRLDRARDFIREARNSDPAPLYFLWGEEAYLLDQAVDTVIDAAIPEGKNDFNFESFRGRDATAEQIREAAEMLPMMADTRVVLVKDTQHLAASALDELTDYFEDPAESTCLIFHALLSDDGPGIDGRASAIKSLKKHAVTCEFEGLYDSEIGEVVRKHADQRNLSLDREAAAYLVEAVGTDIAQLDRALDKVDLYLADREQTPRQVDVDDVESVTAHTRVRSIFDLTDELGDREYRSALKILDAMLQSGKEPIPILFMIARHFRIVGKLQDPDIRSLSSKKKRASEVGVMHWFIDDYERHARAFSSDDVAHIRQRIRDVDRALKSSGLDDRTLLEGLLYDICFRDGDHAAAPPKGA